MADVIESRREGLSPLRKARKSLLFALDQAHTGEEATRADVVVTLLGRSFERLVDCCVEQRRSGQRGLARPPTGIGAGLRFGLAEDTRFLDLDQALAIELLEALRRASAEQLLAMSEAQLTLWIRVLATVFCDIVKRVFAKDLAPEILARVPPTVLTEGREIGSAVTVELDLVRKLMVAPARRQVDAIARVRPLATLDRAARGDLAPLPERELVRLTEAAASGGKYGDLFPGLGALEVRVDRRYGAPATRLVVKRGASLEITAPSVSATSVTVVPSLAHP